MSTDYKHDLQLYGSYVDSQNKPMACRQDNHRLMQVWKRQSLSRVQLFVIPWIVAFVHGALQARILEWVAISLKFTLKQQFLNIHPWANA